MLCTRRVPRKIFIGDTHSQKIGKPNIWEPLNESAKTEYID